MTRIADYKAAARMDFLRRKLVKKIYNAEQTIANTRSYELRIRAVARRDAYRGVLKMLGAWET